MKTILKYISGIIFVVIVADFICFCLWILLDQYPADNFFLGTITNSVLRLIIK